MGFVYGLKSYQLLPDGERARPVPAEDWHAELLPGKPHWPSTSRREAR